MDGLLTVTEVATAVWAWGVIMAYVAGCLYYPRQEWFTRHGRGDFFLDVHQHWYIFVRSLMSWWQLIRIIRWTYPHHR